MTGTVPWRTVDAVIVGGGPAGAVAAIRLAGAGKRVLLIEKERLPRYKPCGGGLVWRARASLPFDIADTVERECRRVLITYKRLEKELAIEDERPLVSMVMRPDLDRRLLGHARDLGAEIVEAVDGWRLKSWHDRVELEFDGKTVQANWLIAADGANSKVARRAGWKPFRHLVPAIECELAVDRKTLQRFGDTARFDFDFPATGYGWVFPKRDHLSVGVASFDTLAVGRSQVVLKRTLADYLHLHRLPAPRREDQHGYVIPVAPRTEGMARGRVMLVGDAAGLADPVTAEGLSHALHSGGLAADAIVAGDADASAAARYDERIKQGLLPELKQGRWLGRLLYTSVALRSTMFDREGHRLAAKMAQIFCGDGHYRDIQARSLRLLQSIGRIGGG